MGETERTKEENRGLSLHIEKHAAVIGETQTGKTVLLNEIAQKSRVPVLVIDVEDVGQIKTEAKFNQNSNMTKFIKALKEKRVVTYVPSENKKDNQTEIKAIWNILKALNQNMLVIVDETQHYGDARKNHFDTYSVRGLKYGVHLVSASQRIANISKTIMNNSPLLVQFDMGDYESDYYKKYKLPHEEMNRLLEKAPKYSYIIYERGIGTKGPYRLVV